MNKITFRELMSLFKNYDKEFMKFFKPMHTYAKIKEDKSLLFKQNNNKSGIYRWVNIINGKSYIGSSVNLTKRLRQYCSVKYLRTNSSYINKALLKYDYINFNLEILEYCIKKKLIKREQYYLNKLKPEYNILKIAGSSLGFKHSKATKLKLSLRTCGVNVKIFDSANNLIKEFSTITNAAYHYGVSVKTISNTMKIGVYKGFKIKFIQKDIRLWVYDSNNNLLKICDNKHQVSKLYKMSPATLSKYIKLGLLYKNKYYFNDINTKL